jgi:hypothetical protein
MDDSNVVGPTTEGAAVAAHSVPAHAQAVAAVLRRPAAWPSLAFAVVLFVFIFGPVVLTQASPFYPLLRWGEILDLFAPLAVVSIAWLLFTRAGTSPLTDRQIVAFLLIIVLWVEGHSLHLAANAISHFVDNAASGPLAELTYFLDEYLSHFIWHGATLGLTALVAWRGLSGNSPATRPTRAGLTVAIAAAVYGFTFFAMIVEGQTAILGLPAAAVIGVAAIAGGRRRLTRAPAAAFVFYSYAAAIVLSLIWFVLNDFTFPEFSAVGII